MENGLSIFVTKSYDKKGHTMKAKKSHPGFAAVQARIAKKQGISKDRAGAILAAGARKAGPAALKKNPNLKRVSGVKKTARKGK